MICRGSRPCPAGTISRVRAGRASAIVSVLACVATSALAQEPPDSVQPGDTVAVGDTLGVEPDTLAADTIFYNMPSARSGLPAGYATGVWEWDRHAIMASGANTLAELFQDVPGLIVLLGGDYGTPAAMSAFGQGGAGYRVVRDGFELYPVDGGVADLQRIGLAGVGRVRLDRSMGAMVVELHSQRYDDGRPISVVEAGTGDLDTNLFRGVYADPTALLGSIAVGLERIDTRGRGPSRDEGGNRTGSWARYQYHLGDRAAFGIDFRRVGSQTRVPVYAPTTTRTDVMVKAGWRVVPGVTLEGYTGRAHLDVGRDSMAFDTRGGTRTQHGGRLGVDVGGVWANGSARLFEGDLPAFATDAEGGYANPRWGGVAGRWGRASWNDVATSTLGARAWVSPLPGATLFAAYESGEYGSREGPLMDEARPPLLPVSGPQPGTAAITERETLRAGASLTGWGVTLAGAALYAHSDSVLPLTTELDVGSRAVRGVHRNGYEGMAVIPTLWRGLTVEGSYQWWDEEGPYLPEEVYRGSFEFHRVYKESENLEFWASLGVRGHDPMAVFVPATPEAEAMLSTMPFYQNWYFRVQVRVVTVRLWFGMDNFTFRRNLQTHPDRLLPYARTFFALRWDMWN